MRKEQAIELAESKWWESKTYREIVEFQLFEDRLCMPFDVFHEALEKSLDRPVFTHELAFRDRIEKEFLGERERPTFDEIINIIPKDKRLIIAKIYA